MTLRRIGGEGHGMLQTSTPPDPLVFSSHINNSSQVLAGHCRMWIRAHPQINLRDAEKM
jgi:hypothetical protein